MSSTDRERALIDRLLADPAFRRAFLADAASVLQEVDLPDLVPAIQASEHAPVALEGRQSRSGLGGVAVATAVAAIGALEFSDHAAAADVPSGQPSAGAAAPGVASVGAGLPPVDPAAMTGPNRGGVLHASEFGMPDPEGAPGPSGRVHAGYDLFAAAGSPVRSPVAGIVVEASPSRGTSGQIFGGVVKVQAADERIWVFRHVVPGQVVAGQHVDAGAELASVSPWTDGTPHVHMEIWRTLEGGYDASNMDDPFAELARILPVASQGTAAPPIETAAAPAALLSKGRASGVFQTVDAATGTTGPPASVDDMPPASVTEPLAVSGAAGPYPGDGAPREEIAAWLGRSAASAGLPAELPVMASLVESGMRNLSYGDRDSVGFFQMRTGIWNSGPYAGYPDRPELQLQWFIDHAVAIKAKRIAAGDTGFGADPSTFGEWIADVERPAEQYRGRYQLRLDEARALLRPAASP